LVVDDVIPEDDNTVPDLIPHDDTWAQDIKTPYDVDGHWASDRDHWSKDSADWNHMTNQGWASGSAAGQGLEFDKMDYMNRTDPDFVIDGRVDYEETSWWNPIEREKSNRPGPGILSPVLAEELHDSNHSLFSINIISPPAFTVLSHPPKDQLPSIPASADHSPVSPPTEDEIRTAVPHPNAYYCPKDNGWVILSWKSSSVTPPLARSFSSGPNAHLPDQARRRRTGSCIEEEDQPFGKMNKSHHFHKYEKAVDSHKLTPPLRLDEWRIIENVKLKRRAGTIIPPELDINAVQVDDDIEVLEKGPEDDEGKLLDLYVCCQCSFYCVASGIIPGVIPRKYIDEVIRDKRSNPPVGKTGDQAVVCALETFTVAIANKLWKGNNRMIKVFSSGFQTKVGWTSTIKRIFDILGFVEEMNDRECTLRPPITDNTPLGKQNRRKFLRAWVEIHAWLADFKRLHASQFKDAKDKSPVQLDNAREMYQTAIGAHPDQVSRGRLSDSILDALRPLEASWKGLGLTPTTYSAGDHLLNT
jgi:ubiquitin carboxyl-terminal hydrolase 25/28